MRLGRLRLEQGHVAMEHRNEIEPLHAAMAGRLSYMAGDALGLRLVLYFRDAGCKHRGAVS